MCGGQITIILTVIVESFSAQTSVRYLGYVNAFSAVMMACAPGLGAWMQQWVGWYACYGLLACLSVIAWCVLYAEFVETRPQQEKLNIMRVIRTYGQLLSYPRHHYGMLTLSLISAGYIAFLTVSSFLYQQKFGISLLDFRTIVLGLWLFLEGQFYDDLLATFLASDRKLLLLGLSLMGLCFVGLLWADTAWACTLCLMLYAYGFALFNPLLFHQVLKLAPQALGHMSALAIAYRHGALMSASWLTSLYFGGDLSDLLWIMGSLFFIAVAFLCMFYRHGMQQMHDIRSNCS